MDERQRHLEEIERIKIAIKSTRSKYLKRDYTKAYKRMMRELHEYDFYRRRVITSEAK